MTGRTDRLRASLVYPVYSRRSGGLSIGINLFPDRKLCSFDCPYCEVFPFSSELAFSLPVMERALREEVAEARAERIPIRDFCFSGNGEPTLSPDFPAALAAASALRTELAPEAALVLISNGSTLADPELFALLEGYALGIAALDLWLKLDAGTEEWYRSVDRSELSFGSLLAGQRRFAAAAPFTVQTMLCAVDGRLPGAEEAAAWEDAVLDLCRIGAEAGPDRGPRRVQLYGKARPAPEDPLASAAPRSYLDARAASLSLRLSAAGFSVPVAVFP